MYQQNFDFSIPEKYRGKKIEFPKYKVKLSIPENAIYLDVNPLEDEEEFHGIQGASDRQRIIYYGSNEKVIDSEDLDSLILTDYLMHGLEKIFTALY